MRSIFLGGIVAAVCLAQTAEPKLEFEVASVKPSAPFLPSANANMQIGVHIDGSQVRITQLSVKDYIQMAYGMKEYQVISPDWIRSDRFDITAKVPEGTKVGRDTMQVMMKALLAERFQLKAHNEKREFPVYGLTVAKGGLKMQESPLDPEVPGAAPVDIKVSGGANGTTITFGRGAAFSMADAKIEMTKMSMVQIADSLARFLDRPVVDQTGLTSTYNCSLNFSPDDFRAMIIRSAITAGLSLPPQAIAYMEQQSGDSLFTAMQAVGLKLERTKAPLDVLVVDSALKTPLEN